jgi:hypothetical protein
VVLPGADGWVDEVCGIKEGARVVVAESGAC